MYITKTNIIKGVTPSIIDGASNDLPSNITNPDFSANYTGSGQRVVIKFGPKLNLSYIAVSAFGVGSAGRIVVRNGETTVGYNSVRGEYATTDSHVCMFAFESEDFSDLVVVVDSENPALLPTINYVAAGEAVQIPNGGEIGGYLRNSLIPATKSRTITGENAAPVANLTYKQSLRGSLSLPNMRSEFVRGDWLEFQKMAATQPFFIVDDINSPQYSICGFEPQFSAPRAHQATRSLENVSISFRVYNGL